LLARGVFIALFAVALLVSRSTHALDPIARTSLGGNIGYGESLALQDLHIATLDLL
jgi:hypothetical protein